MLNPTDFQANLVSITKNLVSTQTETHLTVALGSPVFNATHGWGIGTNTSVITVVHAGGFKNQRMTANMIWVPPTASPNEEFGVIVRTQTHENANYSNYYYARVDGGVAKLTKVINGSFTNLSTGAYALAQNTTVTISLQVVDNALTATFNTAAGSPANVSLTATDSNIPDSGLMAFRTLSTSAYCSNFVAEQV